MEFQGKCLIRKHTLPSGKVVVSLTGVFTPAPGIEFDDRDEMWAVKLLATESKKFVNAQNLQFSPEDFLENIHNIQDKSNWEPK